MKTRLISLITALALLFSLAQAESVTDEMSRFTARVKELLNIGDEYTSFDIGTSSDGYYMYWGGDNRGASATVSGEGVISWFDCYEFGNDYPGSAGFTARFPALDGQAVYDAADEFLGRVITGENWGYSLDAVERSLANEAYPRAWINGMLTYCGIPTDISIGLSVDVNSGKVLSYSRSDGGRAYSRISAADSSALTADEAGKQLKDAWQVKPVYYVTDPAEMARLVYLPSMDREIRINAETGSIVEYSDYIMYARSTADKEEAAEAVNGLTQYELEGIGRYDGVMSRAELEASVRAMDMLDLEGWDCEDADYNVYSGVPRAVLIFANGSLRASVTIGAVNGEPVSMYTYRDDVYYEPDSSLDAAAYKDTALEFIAKYLGGRPVSFTSAEPAEGLGKDSPTAFCSFTRVQDGYPFETDSITVTVNTHTGKVCGFWVNWNNGQEFYAVPDTMIGTDTAADTFLEGSVPALMYTGILAESGEWELQLVWHLAGRPDIIAVDAGTGEGIALEAAASNVISYTDTEGMLYADEIAELGLYGIGIPGCGFTSGDICTPGMLVEMLLKPMEFYIGENGMREFARRFGTVPAENVTRAELARILACAAGCSRAAALTGIWYTDAPDWDTVPENLKGSMAVSLALGLIDPDENGNLNPGSPALAAEAMHGVYMLLGMK